MKKLFLIGMISISFNAKAFNCEGLAIAKTLETMTDVTRFHNCKLEVLRIETSETQKEDVTALVSFLVYGKDEFRCKTSEFCPEANYEITVRKECLSDKVYFQEIEKNSNGYNLDKRQISNHMQIKFNLDKDPIEIDFGQSNLAETKRINYIKCQINPLSGN